MNHHDLHSALRLRSPQALADALAQHRNTEAQSETLLDALYNCTAVELKNIHAWAEDWLSDAGHSSQPGAAGARWQAMNTVYQIAATAIKTSGTTVRRERFT